VDKLSRQMAKDHDCRLWVWILHYGGLHRDSERWDSRLTMRENRRNFRWLDRANGQGHYLDRLAREIEYEFPEFGIHDGNDLWAWLQGSMVGVRA
jgi:hypothetical protein